MALNEAVQNSFNSFELVIIKLSVIRRCTGRGSWVQHLHLFWHPSRSCGWDRTVTSTHDTGTFIIIGCDGRSRGRSNNRSNTCSRLVNQSSKSYNRQTSCNKFNWLPIDTDGGDKQSPLWRHTEERWIWQPWCALQASSEHWGSLMISRVDHMSFILNIHRLIWLTQFAERSRDLANRLSSRSCFGCQLSGILRGFCYPLISSDASYFIISSSVSIFFVSLYICLKRLHQESTDLNCFQKPSAVSHGV